MKPKAILKMIVSSARPPPYPSSTGFIGVKNSAQNLARNNFTAHVFCKKLPRNPHLSSTYRLFERRLSHLKHVIFHEKRSYFFVRSNYILIMKRSREVQVVPLENKNAVLGNLKGTIVYASFLQTTSKS